MKPRNARRKKILSDVPFVNDEESIQGGSSMKLAKMFANLNTYFSEAVARIFSPRDDMYPATGEQPFEGDPYKGSQRAD